MPICSFVDCSPQDILYLFLYTWSWLTGQCLAWFIKQSSVKLKFCKHIAFYFIFYAWFCTSKKSIAYLKIRCIYPLWDASCIASCYFSTISEAKDSELPFPLHLYLEANHTASQLYLFMPNRNTLLKVRCKWEWSWWALPLKLVFSFCDYFNIGI